MRRQSPSGSGKAEVMSIVADSSAIRAPPVIYAGATVRNGRGQGYNRRNLRSFRCVQSLSDEFFDDLLSLKQ